MKNDRIIWLDTAKGIGIILVVFGHLQTGWAHSYLYTFLMPLFFFIAGQTSANIDSVATIVYFKKQIRSLMYPYYLWGVILFLFWFVFDRDGGSVYENILGLLLGFGGSRYMAWGVMFWFLPSLLAAKLLYFLIHRYCKPIKVPLLLISIGVGFVLGYYNIWLPYSIHSSLVLIFFFHLGYKLKLKLTLNKYIILIVSSFLWYLVIPTNGDIVTYLGRYGNPYIFILGASFGVMSIISLSQLLQNFQILSIIGKNTLVIFITHLRAITLLKAIQLYLFKIPIQDSLLYSVFYTIFTIIISLQASKIIKKYFPMLIRYDEIKRVN